MNIQTELYKFNNLDNINDVDEIYNNQVFINKLSDKYKRVFLSISLMKYLIISYLYIK